MRTAETYYVYDIKSDDFDMSKDRAQMEKEGFIVFRNVMPRETVDALVERSKQVLSRPALGGSWGYYRKDIFKKTYDGFLLGRPAIDVVSSPFVTDFVQDYIGSKVILSEAFFKCDEGMNHAYFPLHSDFSIGWTMPLTDVVLKKEHFNGPIAVGGIMYPRDTEEGAFLYAPGSHRDRSFEHSLPSDMAPEVR